MGEGEEERCAEAFGGETSRKKDFFNRARPGLEDITKIFFKKQKERHGLD